MDENQGEREEKQKALTWIQQRLEAFKRSEYFSLPQMACRICECEQALYGEPVVFSSRGLLGHLQGLLREMAFLQASFGESFILEGWANYELRTEMINFTRDAPFPHFGPSSSSAKKLSAWRKKHGERREISRSTEDGKKLIKRLGSGYVRAYQLIQDPLTEGERILIERGGIESFAWPECFEKLRKGSDFDQWQLACDISAAEALKFLSQLATFGSAGQNDLVKRCRSASPLERDNIGNQWFLETYFKEFSPPHSSETPVSKQALLDLIEKFLINFVRAQQAAQTPQWRSETSKRGSSHVLDLMKEKLLSLSPEDRKKVTVEELCRQVKQAAPPSLKKTLSQTLFKRTAKQARIDLLEQGEPWPIAPRGKDRSKRRSA